MEATSDAPLDQLWKDYGAIFRETDDLSLARWLCQTLGQLHGRCWRLSHPLLGAYRLAAQCGHDRQIWHKRLATPPQDYWESPCCRAPFLPLFSRDILDAGLICQHCGDTGVPFDDLPAELREEIRIWADKYAQVHSVAHWDDVKRKQSGHYEGKLEEAATEAERLLSIAGRVTVPKLLEHYPAVVWEDQDECLEVRPEDIK